jgi:hypothetical protein
VRPNFPRYETWWFLSVGNRQAHVNSSLELQSLDSIRHVERLVAQPGQCNTLTLDVDQVPSYLEGPALRVEVYGVEY